MKEQIDKKQNKTQTNKQNASRSKPFLPSCTLSVAANTRMHWVTPRMPCDRHELLECGSVWETWVSSSVFCHFWQSSDKMTAQEQMKKMLDELMGTQRDGEYKICDAKVKLARYVDLDWIILKIHFSTFMRLASSILIGLFFVYWLNRILSCDVDASSIKWSEFLSFTCFLTFRNHFGSSCPDCLSSNVENVLLHFKIVFNTR